MCAPLHTGFMCVCHFKWKTIEFNECCVQCHIGCSTLNVSVVDFDNISHLDECENVKIIATQFLLYTH